MAAISQFIASLLTGEQVFFFPHTKVKVLHPPQPTIPSHCLFFPASTPNEVYPPHQPVSQPPSHSKAHIRDRHGHHDINVFYGQTAAVCEYWGGGLGGAFFASWPATTLPPAWRKALTAVLVFMVTFRHLRKDTASACEQRCRTTRAVRQICADLLSEASGATTGPGG